MILNGKFDQKTAIVTGAGSVIGWPRSVVRGLARDGAKVVLGDLSRSSVQYGAKESAT